MMEKDITVSPHPANSQINVSGLTSIAPPTCETSADGQSVENIPSPKDKRVSSWFVIRATRGRGQEVYDEIVGLNLPHLEVYIPRYHREHITLIDGIPTVIVNEGLCLKNLLFVRTTREEYVKLIHGIEPYPYIKGLTPYYDHFHEIETGRNEYLTVPDRQFRDFRTILESDDTNVLIDQEQMPAYLNGKKVEVTSGPFTGITGTMLRWKGLRRVFVKLDRIGTVATGFIRTCDFRLLED